MQRSVDQRRVRRLADGPDGSGPVIYWMSRDLRAADNWALIHAQEEALARGAPLIVVSLESDLPDATRRHAEFRLEGLVGIEKTLAGLGIGFVVLRGDPLAQLPPFLADSVASLLVTDFDPLRIKQQCVAALCADLPIPIDEVDAHNIVPCWFASPKREYAAYTLRPKLNRLLPEFLVPFPKLRAHPFPSSTPAIDWAALRHGLPGDRTVAPVADVVAGAAEARRVLERFLSDRLGDYPAASRNPAVCGLSELSPYLHTGQIAAQRVALEVSDARVSADGEDAFLEQLIVRRELSDNFCFYTTDYDQLSAAPAWALETLDAHRGDPREWLYDTAGFERAKTHDPLWNAAQQELCRSGRMHGYLRMYWAKKVLEWSASPEAALATVIYLNDHYALDGCDPNGYVGAIWSVAGVHDRPWKERPIFGKIRYMNAAGCRRKFDVEAYIARVAALPACA